MRADPRSPDSRPRPVLTGCSSFWTAYFPLCRFLWAANPGSQSMACSSLPSLSGTGKWLGPLGLSCGYTWKRWQAWIQRKGHPCQHTGVLYGLISLWECEQSQNPETIPKRWFVLFKLNQNFFPIYLIYLFLNSFVYSNWRIITLQYHDGFCHTSAWIDHRHTCIPSILNALAHPSPRNVFTWTSNFVHSPVHSPRKQCHMNILSLHGLCFHRY